jgi:two-component system OmpR family response regulator/two-component system alkaline phosphatase synthesis response regulator PhoP
VLVVEDDPDVLQILRVNLEAAGLDTMLAADGDTAFRRIEEERPDAILLDLMLPVMDGWAILAALTSRADAPPVVVCSSRRGEAELDRATRLGAFDYVLKPFDPERVVMAARRATGLDPVEHAARVPT